MVIESDLQKSDQDDSKTELVVNTSAFTNEDFRTYINICEKIQYNEQLRRSKQYKSLPRPMITATMTREEIFECSTLDEDGFLKALEHQNSYVAPPLRNHHFSQSMTEAMQYFDEDVVVESGSSTAHTPVKQRSKVTSALANVNGKKGNSTPSPPTRRHKWNPPTAVSSKIQELKKQYEVGQSINSRSPKKLRSPKGLRKSMVKQLAKIFNSKVVEMDTKRASDTEQKRNAKTRSVRVSYRPQILPSPVHSPRSKRRQNTKTHCLVAEHIFKQLSVKDKASLFNKNGNVEDISQNGAKWAFYQEPKQTKSRRRLARGEVINEKQVPVKQLTQKFSKEAKRTDQQQTVAKPIKVKNNPSTKVPKVIPSSSTNNAESQNFNKSDQDLEKQSEPNQNIEEVTADEGFVERTMVDIDLSKEIDVNSKSSDISIISVTNQQASTVNRTTSSYEEAIEHEATPSSLSKLGSDTSYAEQSFGTMLSKALGFGRAKTSRSKRKNRMRRILLWKPEHSMVEAKPVPSTDSDSETEYISTADPAPVTLIMTKKLYDTTESFDSKINMEHYEPFFDALDNSLRRNMESAFRMRASHSLSIVFSRHLISGVYDSVISVTSHHELSRSCPSLVEGGPQPELQLLPKVKTDKKEASLNVSQSTTATHLSKQPALQPSTQLLTQQPAKLTQSNVSRKLMDSYLEQGFDAGSNALNTTLHMSKANVSQKLYKSEASFLTMLANEMSEFSKTNTKYPYGFSTPIKGHLQQEATTDDALEKLDFSPILATPTKSSNETPSKCSAVSIKPSTVEKPLECRPENDVPFSSMKQSVGLPKNSTAYEPTNVALNEKASSAFWINTGDFCVSLDIYHNTAERLSLLYDIFIQKSYDSQDISFGIDEQMFLDKNSLEWSNIKAHLPRINNCSHYWFASGDMTLPFMGKLMLPEKIKRLFNIVRETVAESGTLRFGVDCYDFSSVPEFMSVKTFINTAPAMTTPYEMASSINSNSIRTSDLDHSSFDSEASSEFSLPTTPLSNNHSGSISMDSAHFTLPQNGFISSECASSLDYDSLGKTPEDAIDRSVSIKETNTELISKPLHMLETQQQKLKAVEQRIHCYANSIDLRPMSNKLEPFKDSSDYVLELQEIIAAIIDIGQVTGFRNCSLHQLESFTYFLSHYADICLDSCLQHLDRILEALKEKRGLKI